jgi:hypothetical protein
MPSIHRQPGRPYWFCAFSIWNPETLTSRRVFRSTKTRDKKQALETCRAWHKAALKARNGKLSVDAAREVIAQGVSDVFTAANIESLPSASINPDLVVRDAQGKIYTVRYEAVNAMLLNEFLKEHRKNEEQGATIARQRKDFDAALAEQQKQIEALTAGLRKVSAQVEASKPAPQVVNNP